MIVNALAFGIVKDIFNRSSINIDLEEGSTVNDLKLQLEDIYPKLKELKSFLIALNNEYANPGDIIKQLDEIAIIPPVSGG